METNSTPTPTRAIGEIGITQTPWSVERSEREGIVGPRIVAGPFYDPVIGQILIVVATINLHHEETAANAQLIAAAPDLLAACKLAHKAHVEHRVNCFTSENVHLQAVLAKAIQKAEGRTNER